MFDAFYQSSFQPAFKQGAWSIVSSPTSRDSGGNSSLYYNHSEYPSFDLSADFDSLSNEFGFSGGADTTETHATRDDLINAIVDLPEYNTLTSCDRDDALSNSRTPAEGLRRLTSSSLSDTSDSPSSFSTDAVSITLASSDCTGVSDNQAPFAITKAGSNSSTITQHSPPMLQALLPQRARGPNRKPSPPRQICQTCQISFGRLSDLRRHQHDLHECAKLIYKCNGCKHGKFGRLDKIKEHCRSQGHSGYSIIEIAAHPEVASALQSSQRRKGARSFS